MKSIDEKIALSEAQWRRYRYENAGVRESTGRLIKAAGKSAAKRIYRLVRTISCSAGKAVFAPSYTKDKENTVVSLTSTKDRICGIFPALYSLALQTRKPDLIVLWLGNNEAYPPRIISRIEDMGITVRYVKDLGPNTKYHHAFAEYKNDLVITADDDIIYHRDMIQELYQTHLKHPGVAVARRVHRMRFDRSRRIIRYRDWIWEYRGSGAPSHDLFATGVGGVLYPPSVMSLECWENTDFLKVCPKADDIWLKFCELKNGIRVCGVKNTGTDKDAANLRIPGTGLASGNVDKEMNDRYIRACARYFGFKDDLCERVLGE